MTGWHSLTTHSDWGQLFRGGWWRRQEDHGTITDRIDGPELRVSFIHRMKHHRDAALRDGTLMFYFRNAGANDQAFIDAFNQGFYDREGEIEALLPAAAELTGQKRNLIEARYDIPTDEHDDFFDAYIAALEQAFVEHAIENEPLVETIGSTYEEALDSYQ